MPRDPLICLAILLAPPPPKISREAGTKKVHVNALIIRWTVEGAEMEPDGGGPLGARIKDDVFPFS